MNWGRDEEKGKWLERWARHFAAKSHGRFQWEDLAQTGWLEMRKRGEIDVRYLSRVAKCVIVDVMREEQGRMGSYKGEGRYGEMVMPSDCLLMRLRAYKGVSPTREPEMRDFFEWVTRGLPREDKLIILLRFVAGLKQGEIGRVVGMTGSAISLRMENILGRLRSRLVDGSRNF